MKNHLFDKIAEEYDAWFDRHPSLYASELEALRTFIPKEGTGLDIGTGTGRFAVELGIRTGVEPSPDMARMARLRGMDVHPGRAEDLPFPDESFEFAMMATVVCFLEDPDVAFREAFRVLKSGGRLIVGMLDRRGAIAREYMKSAEKGSVYKQAVFRHPEQIEEWMREAGFTDIAFCQTLIHSKPEEVERPQAGHGKGSFVVIKGEKSEAGS